jgi:hypothetical protein
MTYNGLEVEEVVPSAPVAKHPVATITLKDVVLSDEQHLVSKVKTGETTYHTRIKSIGVTVHG